MEDIRKKLTEYGKKIVEKGLVAGPGGNISAREGDFVFLSPSGFFLDEINEEEWVKVNIKTGEIYSNLRPTCEISMHLGIYIERPDVKAVFHTHPPITVGLISSGVKFKPFFPDYVAILGKEVPIIDYVQPAGEEIRKAVVKEIKKTNVILLKNHGVVVVGETIKEAYTRSLIVEEAAKSIFVGICCGKLRYFTKKEIEQIENLESEDYRKALLKKQ
ncbi:MAG: class II aldolase/adducin family protein [Candidatus Omnitrophica bacterium]|nr:class II aldolase/adducin family protein [Candidatus Omnitrophota bacterium]